MTAFRKLPMMTSSNGNFFPRYWPFVRGIHRSPVNSPHKDQWRERGLRLDLLTNYVVEVSIIVGDMSWQDNSNIQL